MKGTSKAINFRVCVKQSKFISLMFVCFAASRCMWDLCGVKKEVLIMESYHNVVRLDNMCLFLNIVQVH